MLEAQAIIERIRRVAATVQRLDIAADKAHRDVGPGQLFLARTYDVYAPYLREPWIPVGHAGQHLVIECPANRMYSPGQVVSLIGPIGRPLDPPPSVRNLLLIAYESTPAALLMLADAMLARKGAVSLALIGRATDYPVEALPAEMEIVRAASEGAWTERDKMLAWADQVVAVALPNEATTLYTRLVDRIRVVRLELAPGYAFGLFHGPMPCGVGACQACLVTLGGGSDVPACVDGPAFDLGLVKLPVSARS
jgi:dihydroorotate dehydrogenase electron transfer subunit